MLFVSLLKDALKIITEKKTVFLNKNLKERINIFYRF